MTFQRGEDDVNEATCRVVDGFCAGKGPLCLDCAAACGGKRVGLPKRERGQPCWSCEEMVRERQAEDAQAEKLEALLEAEEHERYLEEQAEGDDL